MLIFLRGKRRGHEDARLVLGFHPIVLANIIQFLTTNSRAHLENFNERIWITDLTHEILLGHTISYMVPYMNIGLFILEFIYS